MCVTVDVSQFHVWDNYGHTMNQVVFPTFHAMRKTMMQCALLWGVPNLPPRSPGLVAINHIPGYQNVTSCKAPCWHPRLPRNVLECDSLYGELGYQRFLNKMECQTSMIYMRNKLSLKSVLYHARVNSTRHRTINHNTMVNMLNLTITKASGWRLFVVNADIDNRTAFEQREMFANCDVAVIPHGAGMANIPFMRTGSTAIIDSCTKGAFWSTTLQQSIHIVSVCNRKQKNDANDIWNRNGVYMDIEGVHAALIKTIDQY